MAEVFTVVALAAGVYVYWIALEGQYEQVPAAGAGTGNGGPVALVSKDEWSRLRGLSPAYFSSPSGPLLKPFGPGDNQQVGGNRMHAVARPAPGRILPKAVYDLVQQTYGMKVCGVMRDWCGEMLLICASPDAPCILLPSCVVRGYAPAMLHEQARPFRCCTLAPGDMVALDAFVSACYTPMSSMMSFQTLPGWHLTRSEMEVVASATAEALACTF
jgi:hypothetical protein